MGSSRVRVLGLDIGHKRVGVAAGDTATRMALPVKVLPAAEVEGGARTWRMLLEDEAPELLVAGLPKTMAGSVGSQARRVREFAEKVAAAAGLPLEFCDERLSSAEAKRLLRAQGMDERRMRGKLDAVAASLFLQAWLDAADARVAGIGDAAAQAAGTGDSVDGNADEAGTGDAAAANDATAAHNRKS